MSSDIQYDTDEALIRANEALIRAKAALRRSALAGIGMIEAAREEKMKRCHDLKTDPEPFRAIAEGRKAFEIRFDDRGFKVGDQLRLRETLNSGDQMKAGAPLIYTGDEEWMKVRYILRGPAFGLKEGWVIMS